MTQRKIAPKQQERKTPEGIRIDKAFYEAANFKALYRNLDSQAERVIKCLRGIQFILDEHEHDAAFISHIPEAAAMLSLVGESLDHWRERLAEHAEGEVVE